MKFTFFTDFLIEFITDLYLLIQHKNENNFNFSKKCLQKKKIENE